MSSAHPHAKPDKMTLDTSALLVILNDEPERAEFTSLIEGAATRQISAVSVLEAAMVVEGRRGPDASADLDALLRSAAVRIVPFDHEQLAIARDAFRRFGKGVHRAGLNFGDCAAYALARWSAEPLLFKGNDFTQTDIGRVR